MQVTKEKLRAQQMVLFHLGYYKGLIDGTWSDASIKAKLAFEADPSFVPAYPNGGLPFGERDKLPKGLRYERGLITHSELTPERVAEIEKAMEARGYKPDAPVGDTTGDMQVATIDQPNAHDNITEVDSSGSKPTEAVDPAPKTSPQDSTPARAGEVVSQQQKQQPNNQKHKR